MAKSIMAQGRHLLETPSQSQPRDLQRQRMQLWLQLEVLQVRSCTHSQQVVCSKRKNTFETEKFTQLTSDLR